MRSFDQLETTKVEKGSNFEQLLRYGIIGISSNATGYLLYLLVTTMGAGVKTTMSFLYVLGVIISFLGNRHWTFDYGGRIGGSFLRFCIAHVFGYILNLSLLVVFVDKLGYQHQWIQLIAILVVAVYLFAMFRLFVFPQHGTTSRKIP